MVQKAPGINLASGVAGQKPPQSQQPQAAAPPQTARTPMSVIGQLLQVLLGKARERAAERAKQPTELASKPTEPIKKIGAAKCSADFIIVTQQAIKYACLLRLKKYYENSGQDDSAERVEALLRLMEQRCNGGFGSNTAFR